MAEINARQLLDANGEVYFPFTHATCVEGIPDDITDFDVGTVKEDVSNVQTDVSTLQSQISSLQSAVANMPTVSDTGWITITLKDGVIEYSSTWTPKARLLTINGISFLSIRGAVKGVSSNGTIATLPTNIASMISDIRQFVQAMSVTSGTPNFNRWRIQTNGNIDLEYSTTNITTTQWVSIDTTLML